MHTLLQKTVVIMIIASFVMMPVRVYADPAPGALPTGGAIVGGAAEGTIDSSVAGALTVNQAHQRMIANWETFNIGKDATVNFNQQFGATSIALNRVSDTAPSQIFGHLNANGRVFIVNPNGVVFGPNSHVDTAGLLASSLNISDTDFMNGNYYFTGEGGSVINQGALNSVGGFVALLGSHVQNSGTIVADLGTVALASGKAMTVSLDSQSVINVTVTEATEGVAGLDDEEISKMSAVENLPAGTISAKGGKVLLTASVLKNIFEKAINTEGVIEATKMSGQDGQIVLEANDDIYVSGGSLTATNISAKTEAGFAADGGIIRAVNDLGDAVVNVIAKAISVVNGSEITASVSGSGDATVSLSTMDGDMQVDSSDILAETSEGDAVVSLVAKGHTDWVFDFDTFELYEALIGGNIYIENGSTVGADVKSQTGGGIAYAELLADGDIVLSSGKVSAVTAASGEDRYSKAHLDSENGSILSDADSLITSEYVHLEALKAIGSVDSPVNTDTRNLSAYSSGMHEKEGPYGTGNIVVNNIGTDILNVGAWMPYSGDGVDYEGEAVRSNNGLVSVTTQGDMVVHNVIAMNGGVFLESQLGSIFAGDYVTEDLNVTARGYTYISAPNGMIGVGEPGDGFDGISGQVFGYAGPGITAVTGVDPSPDLDRRFGDPAGFVYYQQPESDVQSIWPTAGSAEGMNNPLNVHVDADPALPSVMPAGFVPTAGLTLRLGLEQKHDDDPLFPAGWLDRKFRAYYEILNPYRYTSFEPTEPTGFYAYHPLKEADTGAYDGIGLDPEAYEFIDGNLKYNGAEDPFQKKQI